MIAVKMEDRDALRFLRVDDMNSAEPKIVEYRFARVVFRVISSPFLLNAALLKYIPSYEREDPEFVSWMLRSFYVDDLSISLEGVEELTNSTSSQERGWLKRNLTCANG